MSTATLPESPLLFRADLARMFGVGVETIRRWERAGELPEPIRIGRRPRWRPDQIAGLLQTEDGTDADRRPEGGAVEPDTADSPETQNAPGWSANQARGVPVNPSGAGFPKPAKTSDLVRRPNVREKSTA